MLLWQDNYFDMVFLNVRGSITFVLTRFFFVIFMYWEIELSKLH